MGSQGMGENAESSGYILKVEHRICFLDVGHEEETGQGRPRFLLDKESEERKSGKEKSKQNMEMRNTVGWPGLCWRNG